MNDLHDLHDLHDDDLRQLLPTLDRIEPAPPELVERLWHELQPVLDDGATGKVATLRPHRTPTTGGRHQWTMLAAVAAVVAVFAAGVVLLTSRGEPSEPDAVADPPRTGTELPDVVGTTVPTSPTPTTTPGPATVEAACDAFRRTVVELVPFESLQISPPGIEPLATWVEGLGTLLSDIDRIGRPADSADQYLSIQLLRTALRTAMDVDIEAGNDADALTVLANARRHLEASQQGESELSGCLAGV
jgi:hypothetical protein